MKNETFCFSFVCAALMCLSLQTPLFSKDFSFDQYNQKRLDYTLNLTSTLTAFGGANVLASGVAVFVTRGLWQGIHAGNLAWNGINLILGVMALTGHMKDRNKVYPQMTVFKKSVDTQRGLAVNVGLDIVYIAGGGLTYLLGEKYGNNNWLKGFGVASAYSGAFLLVMDLTFAILFKSQNQKVWPLLENVKLDSNGVSFRF